MSVADLRDRIEVISGNMRQGEVHLGSFAEFKLSKEEFTDVKTEKPLKEKEMRKIASWINEVISNPKSAPIIKKEIKKLCQKFPIP